MGTGKQEVTDITGFRKGLKLWERMQETWNEQGNIVRRAIEYINIARDASPPMRIAMQVVRTPDPESLRKQWKEVKALIDLYFEWIFSSIDAFAAAQGDKNDR